MHENNKAVNTTESAAVQTEKTLPVEEDAEAKIAALEAEKARLIEEKANWKLAALKNKKERKEFIEGEETTDEDRLRRIAREELSNSRLAQIANEQDTLLKKALKENKELKLAQLNRATTTPSSAGSHTEGPTVQNTLVTPEQLAAFKARNWSDKDIERYKKNLLRFGGGIGGR